MVVEDDATLRRILRDVFTVKGYEVLVASDGEEGCRLFSEHDVDLVIADVMMPRMDGFEMVRTMRREGGNTQYLFLSARSDAEDVVEGFRSGGHDYLRKPFAISELMARVEALIARHGDNNECDSYDIGRYTFNSKKQTLAIEDYVRHLSTREAAILTILAQNRDKVVSSHQLLMEIWGDDSYYNLRSMNVFISKLRTYLSKDKAIDICSIRGVGYKLIIK
jgi:DNA-binding response OmpR family regulator